VANAILMNDKTSHGGVVVEGSSFFDVGGRRVVRVGDKVSCPKHGMTFIATGDATMIENGQALARHGDTTDCGAFLISSQSTFQVGSGASSINLSAPDDIKQEIQTAIYIGQ
jgi:uncharacterized Zn-binding protein involved in type VI secretion